MGNGNLQQLKISFLNRFKSTLRTRTKGISLESSITKIGVTKMLG